MKAILTIIFNILLILFSNSQTVDSKISGEFKKSMEDYHFYGLGNNLYFLKYQGSNFGGKVKSVTLDKYDAENQVNKFSLKLKFPPEINYERGTFHIIHLNRNPIMTVSFYNKKVNAEQKFACKIDKETGSFIGNFILLDEAKMLTSNLYNTVYDSPSSDSTNYLIWHKTTKDENKDWSLNFKIINANLEPTFNKDVKITGCGPDILVEEALLSDNKIHFVVADTKINDKNHNYLFSFDIASGNLIKREIVSPEEYLYDVRLSNGQSKSIIFSALSGNKKSEGELGSIADKRKIKNLVVNMFLDGSQAPKTTFLDLAKKEQSEYAENFRLSEVFVHSNGSCSFVMQSCIVESGYQTATSSSGSTSKSYKNIIVANINNDMSLNWSKTIKRKIEDAPSAFFVVKATTLQNKILLFYNDSKDNLTINEDIGNPQLVTTTGPYGASLVTIDEKGNTKKKIFHEEMVVRTRKGFILSPGKMIFYVDENKFMTLKFSL